MLFEALAQGVAVKWEGGEYEKEGGGEGSGRICLEG